MPTQPESEPELEVFMKLPFAGMVAMSKDYLAESVKIKIRSI